jgi:Flp pilus assembly protein TadD
MRNHFPRLLFAAALAISIGCQSPLKSPETANLKPRASLFGESFDADAARAKAEARKQAGENSAIASSTPPPSEQTPASSITQARFREQSTAQPAAPSQQTASHQTRAQVPEAVAQHIRQGSEAMSRQDWANATVHYEAILSADPRNPLAHQMLGRIGDQTQRYESAEFHYLRALSERPQDPNLLSDLGYSYLQQGRLAEAKRFLLKSLSIDANHQMAKANLAAVEAYSGNVDAALALLKQVSSDQEAHRTLYELLNRPAPAVQRDQQLLSQGTEQLPLPEQMRIARETARGERTRREALESLEMRERVRQAMAVGGPLNRMGQGVADEQIGEIIAQIQNEDGPVGNGSNQPDSPPQQYATAPQYGGAPQYGPSGQYAEPGYPNSQQPGMGPQFGSPQQQQAPPNDWSTHTPYYGESQNANYQQQPSSPDPRNPNAAGFGPQGFNGQRYDRPYDQQAQSQLLPPWNGPPPAQNLPTWNGPAPAQSLSDWNGQPQFDNSRSDGNPQNAPTQHWQTPPAQHQFTPSQPPVLNNLQQHNEQLYQQQFGTNHPDASNSNSYQGFPNGQQQQSYAPPSQFQPHSGIAPPASGYEAQNQYGGNPAGNDGYGNQYAPPPSSGVWNPHSSRSQYESQGGAIQQLGYQAPANSSGPASNGGASQTSMQQALRLGMAAGPGSLIQMDGRSPGTGPTRAPSATGLRNQQQAANTNNQSQQFFPGNTQPTADAPSNVVWNSVPNGSRIPSPNQTTWQGGPMPSAAPESNRSGNGNPQQWQHLPSAQQQPQSSTWNHQNQQSVGPMQSRNWSTAESPGALWQSDSFAPSPTTSAAFARGFMLDPAPSQADTPTATMPSFDQQGNPPAINSAAPANPAGSRIPWMAR